MINLLILVHTFPPRGTVGGSIRLLKFLKYMDELGTDINSSIITIRDDFVLLNDPHLSSMSLSELPSKNINIIRTNTFQPRHPNQSLSNMDQDNFLKQKSSKYLFRKTLKLLYNLVEKYLLIPDYAILWFPFLLKVALKKIKEKKIDIIYATAPPFSVLLQAALIKKITKKKLILDIKDDWVYQPRFLTKPFFLKYIEKKMEKFCIKKADKIILVTQNSIEDFNKRYPKYNNKFGLIPNGCDISEYEKYWNINYPKNKKFTMVHSGVLSGSRDPSGFLSALQLLKKENIINSENFEAKFIGLMPKYFFTLLAEKKLQDVITVSDYLEREEYLQTICKADLLLAFNYQIKTLVPGKIYDYWGSRRPILLIDTIDSMAANLVFENELGSVKDFFDIQGIKVAIQHYFSLWNCGSNSYKTKVDSLYGFNRINLTKKFIEIIESV